MTKLQNVSRRAFVKRLGIAGTTCISSSALFSGCLLNTRKVQPVPVVEQSNLQILDDFNRDNSLYLGNDWESMNPGFWKIQDNALRRSLPAPGDPIEVDWFPWHWDTHHNEDMPLNLDPSLPFGMIWRKDWQLSGNYYAQADFQIHALPNFPADSDFQHHQPGYACLGISFGSSTLHESWNGSHSGHHSSVLRSLGSGNLGAEACWMLLLTDDGKFGIYSHATDKLIPVNNNAEIDIGELRAGSKGSIALYIWEEDNQYATITGILSIDDFVYTVQITSVNRISYTNGYLGLVSRGLLDFEISQFSLDPGENFPLEIPENELLVCYPLGDTLTLTAEGWFCTFVAICQTEGERISIKIADQELPIDAWEELEIQGEGELINNQFRRNTAVINVLLPFSPADRTMYYTVWKDGQHITFDPRPGTQSTGPGTGYRGTVPESGSYLGRLPRLDAPYKLCGISSRAIHENNSEIPGTAKYESWYIHDQPVEGAFKYMESYNFQIIIWEDGIWQLTSPFPPPTTSDAYKIINTTLGGPTTRWQMMRHWNVLNPGDEEFGMEDTKGPEQLLLRTRDGLGQDVKYMQRNYQIVEHLCRGDESPDPKVNIKRWRKWRLPAKNLSIYVLDSRTWRTTQDTSIWDDEGWDNAENLNDRSSPSRSLLGEEQFSWLSQQIKTDSSSQICITGINGLHTIWAGIKKNPSTDTYYNQQDRVIANYAGWVKAASDRILKLMGSREGVLSMYGGAGNACILFNEDQRIYECCFGPVGQNIEQNLLSKTKPNVDNDGRPVELIAYYNKDHTTPELLPYKGPYYWNFMEIELLPENDTPLMSLTIRNIIDAPEDSPRGGNTVRIESQSMGRPSGSIIPETELIPNADVQISHLNGEPLRGSRTRADGTINITKLVDVLPGTPVLLTAYTAEEAISKISTTISLSVNI